MISDANAKEPLTVSTKNADTTDNDLTVKQWLQLRKDEAKRIDAETADVAWFHVQTLDPYGVYPDDPPEYQQIGKVPFARSPGSGIWVALRDLPDEIREKLLNRPEALEIDDDLPF